MVILFQNGKEVIFIMDNMLVPISSSARQFGYVIWKSNLNEQMRTFLNNASHVHLIFQGADLGEKRVDWQYRRISIGYRWTRRLDEDISQYIMTFSKREGNKLAVECK